MSVLSLLLGTAYARLWTLPTSVKDLSARTVIITGSNVGLGYEAARSIYNMNPAHLILAVRSVSKGEEAKRSIIASTPKHAPPGQDRRDTKLDIWELDLANFESVKRFAEKCDHELERLDVLLENAGVATGWSLTPDGWESTLQVNVLSTFLLATLLLPLIEKTAKLPPPAHSGQLKPHLVIVASDVHGHAKFIEKSQPDVLLAMNEKEGFDPDDRYSTTKLLDVLLTRELAKQEVFRSGEAVLCSVNPGFCRSELMREAPPLVRWIMYTLLARTTEEGAKNLVWGSLEDNVSPGSYISSCGPIDPSSYVLSTEGSQMQKKMWKEVGNVLAKVAPEAAGIWKA